MFEDSLVESRNRLASKSRRWITVVSLGLQCLVAAVIVILPMVKPEALAFRPLAPEVFVPIAPKPPEVVKVPEAVSRASNSVASPVVREVLRTAVFTSRLTDRDLPPGPPVPDGAMRMGLVGTGMGDPLGVPNGTAARVTMVPVKPALPVRLSAGVTSGMLLTEIRPVYPRIAIAAHQEGVVIIEATISRDGRIESAHVVSGPAMLAQAAIDAVRVARYKPYRLNGEATEVQTTVTVNFKIGS